MPATEFERDRPSHWLRVGRIALNLPTVRRYQASVKGPTRIDGITRYQGVMIAACPALRARARGVLQRRGHTEASVDLVSLAGLYPASVICEIVKTTAPWREYLTIGFCTRHDLIMFTITDLVQYRLENDDQSRTMNSSPHLWPTTKVWSLRLNQAHVDHRVFGAFCDKLRG